ncbi:hypothetical protein R6Z07F_002696 [Ovis aries]
MPSARAAAPPGLRCSAAGRGERRGWGRWAGPRGWDQGREVGRGPSVLAAPRRDPAPGCPQPAPAPCGLGSAGGVPGSRPQGWGPALDSRRCTAPAPTLAGTQCGREEPQERDGCGENPARRTSRGAAGAVVRRAGAARGQADPARLSPRRSLPVLCEPRGRACRPPPPARPQKRVRTRLSMLARSPPRLDAAGPLGRAAQGRRRCAVRAQGFL